MVVPNFLDEITVLGDFNVQKKKEKEQNTSPEGLEAETFIVSRNVTSCRLLNSSPR